MKEKGALLGKGRAAEGRDPLVTGEEALATHRLIEQVLAAAVQAG
jgi:hypothetical protein